MRARMFTHQYGEVIMAKVLVLYYSSYGHIETMAYAVAEGARAAGADVVVKRVPELGSGRNRQELRLQDGPGGAYRHHSRAARVRCDHLRYGHALWQHDVADEEFYRPDRQPLG